MFFVATRSHGDVMLRHIRVYLRKSKSYRQHETQASIGRKYPKIYGKLTLLINQHFHLALFVRSRFHNFPALIRVLVADWYGDSIHQNAAL